MRSSTLKGALAALAVAMFVMATGQAEAALISASTTAPAIDGADIANYASPNGTVKWWTDTPAHGQSFTTGSLPVYLNAVTFQNAAGKKAEPTKTYHIRVGTISGNSVDGYTLTELHAEDATQTFTWNGDEYMTWSFDSPVLLAANTLYGVEIDMTGSTSGWNTGIPYIYKTGNEYAAGSYFSSDGVQTTITPNGNMDLVFHLDMSPVPEPGSLLLLLGAGLALAFAWRRGK